MAPFGEEAVAGMAIVGRIVPIAFAVIFALSGALGPIIGQNFGAGKYDRVRGAVNEGILFIAIYTIGVSAILFLLRQPITILFQAEGISRDLIYLFCGPLALAWFANGVIFASNAAFNNLGHPYYSTWINWGRHTLGTIPFVIGGAYLFGAEGVLIGQAAGGVIFALAAWVMVRRVTAIQDQITHSAQPLSAPGAADHAVSQSPVNARRHPGKLGINKGGFIRAQFLMAGIYGAGPVIQKRAIPAIGGVKERNRTGLAKFAKIALNHDIDIAEHDRMLFRYARARGFRHGVDLNIGCSRQGM